MEERETGKDIGKMRAWCRLVGCDETVLLGIFNGIYDGTWMCGDVLEIAVMRVCVRCRDILDGMYIDACDRGFGNHDRVRVNCKRMSPDTAMLEEYHGYVYGSSMVHVESVERAFEKRMGRAMLRWEWDVISGMLRKRHNDKKCGMFYTYGQRENRGEE